MIRRGVSYLFFAAIAFLFIGFSLYANSLHGEFIWDDHFFITGNAALQGPVSLRSLFSPTMGIAYAFTAYVFRPLQVLSYHFDYFVSGYNPFGYHCVNVLLHVLVAMSVFWLVHTLMHARLLAFLSGILFVVHPVHTSAVSYISGRGDLLSALGMLAALNFYITADGKSRFLRYLYAFSSFAFALLSKENALIFPVLIIVYHATLGKKIRWIPLCLFFLSVLAYGAVRRETFAGFNSVSGDLLQRIPGFFAAVTGYVRIMVFPMGLHMDYGDRLFHFLSPCVAIGIVLVILFGIVAFVYRKKYPVVSFGICWFFAGLLPTTGIYPPALFYMAEHWLYFPSIGLFIIAAFVLHAIILKPRTREIGAAVTIICITVLSIRTIQQNTYWRAEIPFYQKTLAYSPESSAMYHNLALAYLRRGQNREARDAARMAVLHNPGNPVYHYGLGNAYVACSERRKACDEFLAAIRIHPHFTEAYIALGEIYSELGDKGKAADAYAQALKLNPFSARTNNNLACMLKDMGKLNEAIRLWVAAVELEPDFAEAQYNLAVFYFERKDYRRAIEHCDKVLALGYGIDAVFLERLKPYRNQ